MLPLLRPVALAASLVCAAATVAAQDTATILVMDGSGSMWGQIDGRTKLEIARETVAEVLDGLPSGQNLGLMAYGHRVQGDCGDIELMVAPGPGTAPSILEAVNAMRFQGRTPLTEAVRQAAEALRSTEAPATVILVTDGIETCEADPCALAAELEASGVDFTAHVIGFGLSPEDGATLSCIAANTGGRYIAAGDAESLAGALAVAVAGGDLPAVAQPFELAEPPPQRHFPGAQFMPGVQIAPTGQSFGPAVESPAEPDFPADGTTLQCQAACEADGLCGSWRYEPAGSFYVDHARCFLFSPQTEFIAGFYPPEEGWASGMKPGVPGLTRPYVALGAADVAATLTVPGPVEPGAEFTVLWSGPAGESDWVDLVPVGHAELSGEISYFYVNDTIEAGDRPEGAGTLVAPAEPGRYDLRYILGRPLDRRVILTVPLQVGGGGPGTAGDGVERADTGATGVEPGTAPGESVPAAIDPVPASFTAHAGGYLLTVSWSVTPVAGQGLPPEAWAPDPTEAAATGMFLPGEYDVVGQAGDSVFADRVTITAEGPNDFLIPLSAALSPAGEDAAGTPGK